MTQLPENTQLKEFSLYIDKAGFHKESGEMRFHAVGSDTLEDSYRDNMTAELFADFLERIASGESPPDGYGNDFWNGGMPYLSISHYPDFEGKAVPGELKEVYVDGNRLKGRGLFYETPLGFASFKSVCKDQTDDIDDNEKVRISIAFLDWKHQHKSNGFVFERKSITDRCPECIKEFVEQSGEGKEFLRGHLVHWALTRVPVNPRTPVELEEKSMSEIATQKDDAAAIVGEELAKEIDEMKAETRSEALVIKSDEVEVEKKEKPEDYEDDDEKKKKKEEKSEYTQILELLTKEPDKLDEAYGEFRSAMAQVNSLEELQPAFEKFGNVIRGMYTEETSAEETPVSDPRIDKLVESMSLLAEKVDLLTKSNPKPVTEVVPERRSITLDPTQILHQPRKPMTIQEIANQSVGLS